MLIDHSGRPPEWLRRLSRRLRHAMAESAYHARHNATLVGILGVAGFPLYYYIWEHLFPQPYESLWLRLTATVLFVPLVLYRFWPERFNSYFTVYWMGVLVYALPFFFSYMLLRNDMSLVWSMSTMAALFLLVLVVHDWIMVFLMAAMGLCFAWLAFFATTGKTALPADYILQLPIYAFVIVAGNIFNYRTSMVKEEKMDAYATMGRNIAHELRTPLLGIRGAAGAIRDYLPALVDGYSRARDRGLPVRPIRDQRIQGLEQAPGIILDEVTYSNTVIDMLLFSAAQTGIDESTFGEHSIAETLNTALARYPFRSRQEAGLVRLLRTEDFTYLGPQILLVHVIFNLIKNALQSIQSAGTGEVTLYTRATEAMNRLVVRDTGPGIEPGKRDEIFEMFVSTKDPATGTGLGLSFCRLVMENLGGCIECRSRYGEYAEFTLYFPHTANRTRND